MDGLRGRKGNEREGIGRRRLDAIIANFARTRAKQFNGKMRIRITK